MGYHVVTMSRGIETYVVSKVKYEDINHGVTHDAVLTCDCQAELDSE